MHEGGLTQKTQREEMSRDQFWLLFLDFFFLFPLNLPYVTWASQEDGLFYLRFSLWPLDLPLFYFQGLSLSLSLNHHHFGLFFPIQTT